MSYIDSVCLLKGHEHLGLFLNQTSWIIQMTSYFIEHREFQRKSSSQKLKSQFTEP